MAPRNPISGAFGAVTFCVDDVCIEGKGIPGPKMSNEIVHCEPHFALHDQSVGVKGVRVRAYNRVRRPLSLKHLIKAACQRSSFEGLKSNVCHGEILSILRSRAAPVPHQARQRNPRRLQFACHWAR